MWNGRETRLGGPLVAPATCPETSLHPIVDVKEQEPVRRGAVECGVLRVAPLAERDQRGREEGAEPLFALGQPSPDGLPLARRPRSPIVSPALGAQAAIGAN